MEVAEAVERVRLGESLGQVSAAYREALLRDVGLDPKKASPTTFQSETHRFMRRLCRELAERHPRDPAVRAALIDWAENVEDYEAFDALLSTFRSFDGRAKLVRRGKKLFPGPLTAHWDE